MANGRNKLRRGDAGRDADGIEDLPWSVPDSPAYLRLSMHARALLLEVARQRRDPPDRGEGQMGWGWIMPSTYRNRPTQLRSLSC